MKAVMYGGGNIGRGFIGALFSRAGYQVSFVDVDSKLIDQLNQRGEYPLRIIRTDGHDDWVIGNVCGVDGKDADAVAQAIAACDVMATAVGAKILPYIAPLIAKGIKLRFAQNRPPLNIIICENLMDANHVLEDLLKKELSPEEQARMDREIGLVEASIGRMVPVQTDAMRDGDPLRVCVETYGFLPVDQGAFRGPVPHLEGMIPFSPFDFYLRRKLYVHNMGHATCAYLGGYSGLDYIWQAIEKPDVELIVQNAMMESMMALVKKYQVDGNALFNHINDLIGRFANRAQMDTCARVGGDTRRKLAPDDRMIGSSRLCLEMGVVPSHIALGAAGAVYQHLKEEGAQQGEQQALRVLHDISGLSADDRLTKLIMEHYRLYARGATVEELRLSAKAQRLHEVGPVA
ncbi:MAG: mannitol dehydrogenase [Clostridiales bacterium]|nr:mannitol dehydrogenase [Clostridiales bacterium]